MRFAYVTSSSPSIIKRSAFFVAIIFGVAAVTVVGSLSPVYAAFPGSNGLILYNNSDGVASVLPNGTGFKQITYTYQANAVYMPSKDGTKIVYSMPNSCPDLPNYNSCSEDIVSIHSDGSNKTTIVHLDNHILKYPAWSPDGTKIVYIDRDDSNNNVASLKITNADGSSIITLKSDLVTQSCNTVITPRFSPDGTKIIFSNQNDLFTINTDGSGLNQLTHETGSGKTACNPDWSPSGSKILFSLSGDVYVMNTDGSGARQLTSDGKSDEPVWSPDGTQIAYHMELQSFRDNSGIYTMNVDGSNKVRILPSGIDSSWPIWTSIVEPASKTPATTSAKPTTPTPNVNQGAQTVVNDQSQSVGTKSQVNASEPAKHGQVSRKVVAGIIVLLLGVLVGVVVLLKRTAGLKGAHAAMRLRLSKLHKLLLKKTDN